MSKSSIRARSIRNHTHTRPPAYTPSHRFAHKHFNAIATSEYHFDEIVTAAAMPLVLAMSYWSSGFSTGRTTSVCRVNSDNRRISIRNSYLHCSRYDFISDTRPAKANKSADETISYATCLPKTFVTRAYRLITSGEMIFLLRKLRIFCLCWRYCENISLKNQFYDT